MRMCVALCLSLLLLIFSARCRSAEEELPTGTVTAVITMPSPTPFAGEGNTAPTVLVDVPPTSTAAVTYTPTTFQESPIAASVDQHPIMSPTRSTLLSTPSPTCTPPSETASTRPGSSEQVIGYSVKERPIKDLRFGAGQTSVVFVSGIHGGHEWNTILLAYQVIDYFSDRPDSVPEGISVHIIPMANPDGMYAVTGIEGRFKESDLALDTSSGRFNARQVDLNRNWDCQWQPAAVWRDQPVSAGRAPFSEPESRALRDHLLVLKPALVVFWHSAANGVFAAGCPEIDPESMRLAKTFGAAAGYPVYERFTAYEVTGDAGNWLSAQGIPSISVELVDHVEIQWEQNLAGISAVLETLAAP